MADLDVLFEACLARLEAGSSVEECLATYPAEAANLSPLLQIVAALQTLGRSKPAVNPAAAQAARTRFLEEAQALGQQPPVSIEEAMQACLAMLAAGKTPEQCLGAFPQHAAALEPVLPTLAALQSAGRPAPVRSLSQVATHRQEFLVAATRYAQQQKPQKPVRREPEPRQSWWSGLVDLFRAPALRWAAILLFVTLLVFSAGRITVSAAFEALPGDALYPVKLATERVALALTLDGVDQWNLVRELEQRRREEAEAVALQRRAVAGLTVPGTVGSISNGVLDVDGVSVVVPPQAKVVGEPGVGKRVVVKASSDRSGTLVAQVVEYEGATPVAVAGGVASATPAGRQGGATPSAVPAPTLPVTSTVSAAVPTTPATSAVTATLPLPLPTSVAIAPAPVLTGTAPLQPATPAVMATAAATSTLPMVLPVSPTLAPAFTEVATATQVLPAPALVTPSPEPAVSVTVTLAAPVAPLLPTATSTPVSAPPTAVLAVQATPEATAMPGLLLPTATLPVQPPPQPTATAAPLVLPTTPPGPLPQQTTATPATVPPAVTPSLQPAPPVAVRTIAPTLLAPSAMPVPTLPPTAQQLGPTAVAAATPILSAPTPAQPAVPTARRPLVPTPSQPAPTVESEGPALALTQPAPVRPTATAPSPKPSSVTIGGVINRITSSGWIIGNTRVARSSGTRIDQSRGPAAVGAEVRVTGLRQPSGSVLATRLVVLRPAGAGTAPTRILPPLPPPLQQTPTPTPAVTEPPAPALVTREPPVPFPTTDLTWTPPVAPTLLAPPAVQTLAPPPPNLPFPTQTPARPIRTPRTPRGTPRPATPTPDLLPPSATLSLPLPAPTLRRPAATPRLPRATLRPPRVAPRPTRLPRRTPTPTPRGLPLPPPTGAPLPLP